MTESRNSKPSGKTVPSARIIRCPGCGERTRYDETNPFRPFCSSPCKGEDIVGWATESYRVAGPSVSPDDLENEGRGISGSNGDGEE